MHAQVSPGGNLPTIDEWHVEGAQLRIACPSIVIIIANMKQIAATEAKNRFGQLLDAVQSAPVQVTKKGRAVSVMMSTQHYERLRGAAWERLLATMDTLGEEASANGLTEAQFATLLSDDRLAGCCRHQRPDLISATLRPQGSPRAVIDSVLSTNGLHFPRSHLSGYNTVLLSIDTEKTAFSAKSPINRSGSQVARSRC